MRADSLLTRWVGLLLAMALLTTSCAALTPSPGRGRSLNDTPRQTAAPLLAERSKDEHPRTRASPPPSLSEAPERPRHRQGSREAVVKSDPGTIVMAAGGSLPSEAAQPGRQGAALTRQAILGVIDDMSGSTRRISGELSRLKASRGGIGGRVGDLFIPRVDYGVQQLRWINTALGGATTLANAASEMDDPDMELGVLRLTGPRLEAVMFGTLLLAAWIDCLNLADVVLKQYHFYSVEKLLRDMDRLQKVIEPSRMALSSLEPGQVEATATALPGLMGQLTREFHATREAVRVATERGGQLMLAAQLVEMLALVSTLKMSLPRLPPPAPATLGMDLVMGAKGVMMGSQIVVTAEWVELMRRLVRAGILSVPVVSAAVRINAGQVMMAQAHRDLPQGVRDALGDGPEVRGMHETGRAGAGMAEPPRHHVLPQEHRAWFEQRGFTGAMDIDQFCVKLEAANHQAIHGGGSWRLGRMWPGEWNQLIMGILRDAETAAGRMLTHEAILKLVAREMKRYKIPMSFVSGRGR